MSARKPSARSPGLHDSPDPSGAIRYSGPWSTAQVNDYLDATVIPIRLSCVDRSGWPRVFSLWYLRRDDQICCSTQEKALIASALAANPRCAFEIAADRPPYRGVRGRGLARVELPPPEDILRLLIQRYLGDEESSLARWLLSRRASEVAIRIVPSYVHSWDYTRRMTSP